MSSIQDPATSTALVLYAPKELSKQGAEAHMRKEMRDVFLRSFRAQQADQRLHPKVQISLPLPECSFALPQRFKGTCAECLSRVKDSVHSTIDNMDYDGLKPYVEIIDQIEKREKPMQGWTAEAQNEEGGSTCVGMSKILLKNIQRRGVEGSLAIEYNKSGEFGHAAIIVECADGLVFIDNRSAPERRLYSIPFNSTFKGDGFSITALPRGSIPPLVIDVPHDRFKYYTHVKNGADIVSKQYMSHAIAQFIPVAVYKKDGNPLKDVIIKPGESRIRLMNYSTNQKDYIAFEEICKGSAWKEKLTKFMGTDFHVPPHVLQEEIAKFASQEHRIKKIFLHSHM